MHLSRETMTSVINVRHVGLGSELADGNIRQAVRASLSPCHLKCKHTDAEGECSLILGGRGRD